MQGYHGQNYPAAMHGYSNYYPQTPYAPPTVPPPQQPGYPAQYTSYSGYPQQNAATLGTPFPQAAAPLEQPDLYSRYKRYEQNGGPSQQQALRSALKKTPALNTNGLPMEDAPLRRRRQSKVPGSADPADLLYRTKSNPQAYIPFNTIHVNMLFKGTDELILEHLSDQAKLDIRNAVVSVWPAGVEIDEHEGYEWRIRFRGSPWDMSGPHLGSAFELIASIFTLFARRGFSIQTTALNSRIIFLTTDHDKHSVFFLGHFSHGGRRFTAVRPPHGVADRIMHGLKRLIPEAALRDHPTDQDGSKTVELTGVKAPTNIIQIPIVDAGIFQLLVIRVLSDMGFNLDTSLKMAPKMQIGPFRFGPRKELLAFKGTLRG